MVLGIDDDGISITGTGSPFGSRIYETAAGAGESLTRQFDDETGGGWVELGDDQTDETESVAGFDFWGDDQENPIIAETPGARTAYDYLSEYDATLNDDQDSADIWGPTVGTVVDPLVTTPEEQEQAENPNTPDPEPNREGQLWLGAIGLGIALFLLAPVFELLAALADD